MSEVTELKPKKGIPLVPSWHAAMQILITVLEDGTEEGKRQAREELMALADKVDQQNDELRAKTYVE